MSERNDAAPHPCPECGEPAYLGFNMPGKCTSRACVMYDADLWVEWIMKTPDPGDPLPLHDDFLFEEEDTFPGIGSYKTLAAPTRGGVLDSWGATLGIDRHPNESDDDYEARLLGCLGRP